MLTRNDIISNLKSIIVDVSGEDNGYATKALNYRDFVYIKQAIGYLESPPDLSSLTAKVDFVNLLTSVSTLISSMELTSEQKELAMRITDLFEQFNKSHIKVEA